MLATGFKCKSLKSPISKSSSSIRSSAADWFKARIGRLRGIEAFFCARLGGAAFLDVERSSRASLIDFLAFSAIFSRASRILTRFFEMILLRASSWPLLLFGNCLLPVSNFKAGRFATIFPALPLGLKINNWFGKIDYFSFLIKLVYSFRTDIRRCYALSYE